MSGLIITSSGTGIGKTFITCALLALDKQEKGIFSASKPIISGFPENTTDISGSDTGLLVAGLGTGCLPEVINAVSPWRFKAPLSPDLAEKLEDKIINPTELIEYSRQQFLGAKKNHQYHLMEGVGGVMCPLAPQFTMLDWIAALNKPCLLVVGTYLGALSHTLTAINALKARDLPIMGIVCNETPESTVSLVQTQESLKDQIGSLPFFAFSYLNASTFCSFKTAFNKELMRLYTHISGAQINADKKETILEYL